MRQTAIEKIHIFIAMFFISLAMSIQGPIFSPYAAMLGASSVLIGIMLALGSFSNLTGNLVAGPLSDRFGKKRFICLSLFLSGFLFIFHGLAVNTANLLILRALNGFSLAFLVPSALALLSGYAKNSQQQGKNMAINGIIGTVASIISPIIGGHLGDWIGYENTYYVIGTSFLLIGVYTTFSVREKQGIIVVNHKYPKTVSFFQILTMPQLQVVFLTAFAVMYMHGVMIYEIPYLAVEQGLSTAITGQLFSLLGIGTFFSLSLFFINRFDPVNRLMFGLFGICVSLFALISTLLPLSVTIFLLGFFFGIIMPAMATAVTDVVSNEGYGRAFGVMSAVYSLGMISSSFMTGVIREIISPYFVAFLICMIALTLIGYSKFQPDVKTTSRISHRY